MVYRVLGKGIVDEGTGNKWHTNLVAYSLYLGIHLNQPSNFDFLSCFSIQGARLPEFIGNVAAGCERGGIHTEGEPCDTTGAWVNASLPWDKNEVHGAMVGVRHKGESTHKYSQACSSFNNFFVWKVSIAKLLITKGTQYLTSILGL